MAPQYPLYQRIALMQLVRQLLGDPLLTYHLVATYDLTAERHLDLVQASGGLPHPAMLVLAALLRLLCCMQLGWKLKAGSRKQGCRRWQPAAEIAIEGYNSWGR